MARKKTKTTKKSAKKTRKAKTKGKYPTRKTTKGKGSKAKTKRKGKPKNDTPIKAHLQEIVSLEARIGDVKGKIDDYKEQAKTHKSRLTELERERHTLIANDTPPLFADVEAKRKSALQSVVDHSAGRGGKGKGKGAKAKTENPHGRGLGDTSIGENVKSKSGNKGKVVAHTGKKTLIKTPGVRELIEIYNTSDEWYPVA